MDYIISDKAKKVTLGLAVVGLLLLVIGFSQQKDFVYAKKVDNHTVEILYNGHADAESQDNLKETIITKMPGYELEFHDASHGNHDEHGEDSHAHHGPTFNWNIHIKHSEIHNSTLLSNHESGADILVNKVESGEVSFFDSGLRRFWSNLLVNGFFFFGIALGALFFLALHYATESGWGVVLLRVTEGIMTAMPIGMGVLVVVFLSLIHI